MEPTKKPKTDGVDRISDLPDSILCKILSFLPTKYATGTCILSTRWKSLFPFIWIPPIKLDLNDTLFFNPLFHNIGEFQSTVMHFWNFTNKLLNETLADVDCLETLRLKCLFPYENKDFLSWVRAALRLNVRELLLVFRPIISSKGLFETIHGCTTLTRLELGKTFTMDLPDDFLLPNLKTLLFKKITFFDEKGSDLGTFFDGCPALEDLTLNSCNMEFCDRIVIRSQSLKNLTLYYCEEKSRMSVFEIDTPNVKVFRYDDSATGYFNVTNFESLLVAHIDVHQPVRLILCDSDDDDYDEVEYDLDFDYDDDDDDDDDEDGVGERGSSRARFADGVSRVVTACSSTVHLYLEGYMIEALHRFPTELPIFQNLNSLALGGLKLHGCGMLARLLWNAPNLEKLRIERFGEDGEGWYSSFESLVPSYFSNCLELHLKEIEISVFKEQEDEIKLVEFFLNNGKVIQTIKLCCLPFKDENTPRKLGILPGHSKLVYQSTDQCKVIGRWLQM